MGTLVVYLLGASYLATLVGFQKAMLLGVLPFIWEILQSQQLPSYDFVFPKGICISSFQTLF